MIDVSSRHPFVACTEFAIEWLEYVADYDLEKAGAMIDKTLDDRDLNDLIPSPDGFSYCPPSDIENWTYHVVASHEEGLAFHFEVPFRESGFRAVYARFSMKRLGDQLEVEFEGLEPS